MNVIMPYIAVTIVIISVAFLVATTIVVSAMQRIATQVTVDYWLPSSTDIIVAATTAVAD